MIQKINLKIITAIILVVWCVLWILIIKSELRIPLLVFYTLFLMPPSLLTIAVTRVKKDKKKKVDASIFDIVTTVILVDFALFFATYLFSFSLG